MGVVGDLFKKAAAPAGAIVGGAFGGPAGAALGGSVGGFLGGQGGALFGREPSAQVQETSLAPRSPEEQANLQALLGLLQQETATQRGFSVDPGQFQNILTNFLAADEAGTISPQNLAQAQEFVDQTFTQPAEQIVNRGLAQFEARQAARATSLGRQPTDTGFQRELARTAGQAFQDLGAQRGQAIGNLALQLPQLRQQRVGFISDLAQRANQNRLNLIAQRSGLGATLGGIRSRGGTVTQRNVGGQTGILEGISGAASSLQGLSQNLSPFGLGFL